MTGMKVSDIVKATNGQFLWGDSKKTITGITTDSRKSGKGAFFVPIEGPTFDGHDFIKAAFDGGAVGAVTHKDVDVVLDRSLIKVENTFKALSDIARYYRAKFDIPFIAITGSVGKTTTKDMVAAALTSGFNVLKTKGNFNNEIGLPQTIFELKKQHEIGVVEMGMSGLGEIHNLASIVKPDVAVITNIGLSHIEKLGSRDAILKAKLEILDFFSSDGLVILNGDDEMLYELKGKLPYKTIYFGIENKECDYVAKNINATEKSIAYDVCYGVDEAEKVELKMVGQHNVYNSLCAIAVARHYGLPIASISKKLSKFKPTQMRMEIISCDGITLINDCYNASPSSMEAAIKVLSDMEAKRKIAILGDILEMGDFAPTAHHVIGRKVAESDIDFLLTVGQNAKIIADGALDAGMESTKVMHFENNKAVCVFLNAFLNEEDKILVKASRGMKFEQISSFIQNYCEEEK